MQQQNLIQQQDTVQQNKIGVDNQLNVERNAIELVQLRSLSVDSTRLTVKKFAPQVKTIPYIPVTDTIEHPSFQVLSQNYTFPEPAPFFDFFNITPLNPNNKVSVIYTKKVQLPDTLETLKQIQTIEQPQYNPIAKVKASKGFGNTDWMLGVIIFSFIIFAWLRVGYSKYFQTAIQATYNYFVARRILEEANVTLGRVFYFMNLLFFINLALFLAQGAQFYKFEVFNITGINLFLLLLATVVMVYFIKSMILRLLDFIFLAKGKFSTYIFTTFLYNKMVGFLLLPLVAALPFVPENIKPWLLYAGISIIILLYIFRLLRGLQIGFKNRLSFFYLILYLCALEILPVFIVIKAISTYF